MLASPYPVQKLRFDATDTRCSTRRSEYPTHSPSPPSAGFFAHTRDRADDQAGVATQQTAMDASSARPAQVESGCCQVNAGPVASHDREIHGIAAFNTHTKDDMASVNRVTLLGNVGRDPELRYLPDGKAATSISLATTSKRKNRDTGEVIEDTQWHRVQFFERLAEIVGEYVRKGHPIYVEGRIKYGKYTDRESGQEKNTVDIVATELQLLGGDRDRQGQQPQQPQQQQRTAAPAPRPQQGYDTPRQRPPAPPPAQSSSGFDDFGDIPF